MLIEGNVESALWAEKYNNQKNRDFNVYTTLQYCVRGEESWDMIDYEQA